VGTDELLRRGDGCTAATAGRPGRSARSLPGREATPETLLSTTAEPLHPLDEQQVADVFTLARKGDQRARAAVDRFIQRLVRDVAALVLALDPELI
jgi:predicted NBD/HSP70 family sugar kinase